MNIHSAPHHDAAGSQAHQRFHDPVFHQHTPTTRTSTPRSPAGSAILPLKPHLITAVRTSHIRSPSFPSGLRQNPPGGPAGRSPDRDLAATNKKISTPHTRTRAHPTPLHCTYLPLPRSESSHRKPGVRPLPNTHSVQQLRAPIRSIITPLITTHIKRPPPLPHTPCWPPVCGM
ncbi:hypothetical protein LZ30DRAFT_94870 [Colletotrichum cereale]|nr:hypothetical protein LZ30DRAFT_94870 [Colletotrichum cereale]